MLGDRAVFFWIPNGEVKEEVDYETPSCLNWALFMGLWPVKYYVLGLPSIRPSPKRAFGVF